MNKENQVCSLELAKKLEALGVPQESYFEWEYDHLLAKKGLPAKWLVVKRSQYFREVKGIEHYSAYTSTELGKILPISIHKKREMPYHLVCRKQIQTVDTDEWLVAYEKKYNDNLISFIADTEANARAKCLVYLLENTLIKLCHKTIR